MSPVQAAESRFTAESLAKRGRKLMGKDDKDKKKLGRGFMSLALHINPFLSQDQTFGPDIQNLQRTEPMFYWRGSVFSGHDKTFTEAVFSKHHLFQDANVNRLLLYAWRNLELTGLSCCGIDNVAVFFQQASKHMYLPPFLDMVPGAADRLKPENQPMATSFKKWWEESGRRPMPEPQIRYLGNGKFEWETMKIAVKKSRMPKGWSELIEAVLLDHLEEPQAALTAARAALRRNGDLMKVLKGLLPDLASATPLPPQVAAAAPAEKYIVCYNPHVGLGNLAVVMVSAHALAKLTGRKLLLHWNVNAVSQHAYKLREQPGVALLPDYAQNDGILFKEPVKHLYLFHMMYSPELADILELLGCSNLEQELSSHSVVTVSTNMYYAPMLAVNPHTPEGAVPGFPQLLGNLLAPSDASAERALDFIRSVQWGEGGVPVVAVHIRAREESEDNDDWPTADSPDRVMLQRLRHCIDRAVKRELKGHSQWDVFIASTTEAARMAVAATLDQQVDGVRRVLTMPQLARNRRETDGAQDAMAEALLISRADVFVRLVIGTTGFSTFAYLSNALRSQNDWVGDNPSLERSGFAPNYLVTESCGPGRCFLAPADVRMANIAWHGKQYTHRSCGDIIEMAEKRGDNQMGCKSLQALDAGSDEL